jgi:dUTP pyrophosphatase
MKLGVKIKRLNKDVPIPKSAHEFDAGVDLVAAEDVIIAPGETKLIPTGIAVSIPPGFEAQVRPRSGITLRTKLRVQLGTIDSGFTGEIGVIVDNVDTPIPTIHDGDIWYESTYVTYDMFGNEYELPDEMADDVLPVLKNSVVIPKGTRIAQLVFALVERPHFYEVETLDETSRGTQGYGSSGVG